MYKGFKIEPPFFEIGPKAYMYGERLLKLAKAADAAAAKYDVRILITPQPSDIYMLSHETRNIVIVGQHIDPIPVGRGQGSILAEALKAAGAHAVMLNHAEKPMTLAGLAAAVKRADEVGLVSIIFGGIPLVFGNPERVPFESLYRGEKQANIIFDLMGGKVVVGRHALICFGIAVAVLAALFLLLKFSKWGLAVRATASNEFTAELMGINSHVITAATATATSTMVKVCGICHCLLLFLIMM